MNPQRLRLSLPEGVDGMRRTTAASRLALRTLPALQQGKPICPAGSFVALAPDGSRGCMCGIEESVITEAGQPTSLLKYCYAKYTACPTWRAEKQRIAENRRQRLIDMGEAKKRRDLVPVGDESTLTIAGNRRGRDPTANAL